MVIICTASLTFNNSTFCPHTVFMCFVWISEQTAIISLYNINWLVFITETESVYCAVRTEAFNKVEAIRTTSNGSFQWCQIATHYTQCQYPQTTRTAITPCASYYQTISSKLWKCSYILTNLSNTKRHGQTITIPRDSDKAQLAAEAPDARQYDWHATRNVNRMSWLSELGDCDVSGRTAPQVFQFGWSS